MPSSEKPHVVERIFDQLWDPVSGSLSRTMISMEDVQQAIVWCNSNKGTQLSTRNPANFWKDVVRGSGGNKMWPQKIKDHRWTGTQRTGSGGNVFEFVPYEAGQLEPFPDRFGLHDDVTRHKVQSLSLPLAAKRLGRNDETYMIQVAVKLAVVETHL